MNQTTEANRSANLTTLFTLTPQASCVSFLNSATFKLSLTLVLSVVLILSLLGNSLVIAVLGRNRRLRTTINYFILNMAVSDVLMPLFALPIRIKDIYLPYGQWLVNGIAASITCKFMPFAEETSTIVSVLTLEFIAVERFFSIVFPMKRQPINSKKKCFILIGLTWTIGVLYSSIHFYKYKAFFAADGTPYCLSSWAPDFNNADAIKIQFPIFFVCFTMLPFILLTSLYSAIIFSLNCQKEPFHLAVDEIQRRTKKYKRATYMLVTVVVVFLVSWTPLNLYAFLYAYVWKSTPSCQLWPVVYSLNYMVYLYPAINPLLYFIFNENFRKGFQELSCFLTRRRSHIEKQKPIATIKTTFSFGAETRSSNAVVFLSMRSLNMEPSSL